MSQAKVDRYKEQKANRQKLIQKEKRERLLWKMGGWIVGLVMVAWIGFSAYGTFHVEQPKTYEVTTDAIDNYLSGLNE